MFIGYARSGHSLTASLLDAHPDIVIANNLDALRYVQAKFGRNQIYSLILQQDKEFTQTGRSQAGYRYNIPNQWQGSFRRLRVIGDKHAPLATKRLRRDPALIEKLQKKTSTRLHVIHVVRNPYDSIATESKHWAMHRRGTFSELIEYYFSLCRTVQAVRETIDPANMMEFSHESFIEDPKPRLRQLCDFLAVECTESYLADCAGVVFSSPRKTRYEAEWTEELIETVRRQMALFDFMTPYLQEQF